MPRLVAIEWDNREARVAVASEKRGQASVEEVFAISFEPTTGPKEIGRQLAAGLAAHKIRNCPALVAVGRTSIELKLFNLPPSPDDELPDMVRFQAPREFTSWGEGWPLDYISLSQDPEHQRTVLAATIAPELVKQIEETCQTAGLKPEHLVLRPCAAASLLTRANHLTGPEPQLLVDLLADEMDLTVTIDGRVVFTRTARLPSDVLATADFAKPLVAEVRRTMGAALNQLGGKRVERIWLCAGSDEQNELAMQISTALSLPVELFDPFAAVLRGDRMEVARAPHRGRFAPVLGMVTDAAAGQAHAIDFLHSKRRPEKPSQRPRIMAYSTAALLLVGVGGGLFWHYLGRLDAEILRLKNENLAQQKIVDQYSEVLGRVTEIETWRAQDVNWLDELKSLAEKLPSADDVMLSELRLNANSLGGGRMEFSGLVKETAVVQKVENSLRDAHHQVLGRGTAPKEEVQPYKYDFGTEVVIQPREAQ